MYDFTPIICTVPMWGPEVANSKTEIHLTDIASEMMWACNVTTIELEGDFTSLAHATAFSRGCQAIIQTAGGYEIPCVIGW